MNLCIYFSYRFCQLSLVFKLGKSTIFLSIPLNLSVKHNSWQHLHIRVTWKWNTTLIIPRHLHCLHGHSEPAHTLCTCQVHLAESSKLFQSDITSCSSWMSPSGSGITLACAFYHSVQVAQATPVLIWPDLFSRTQALKYTFFTPSAVRLFWKKLLIVLSFCF